LPPVSLLSVAILPPVSLKPVANLPPVSLIPWCTLTCKYLREFSKKFETVLMGYSGAGGKLIHEKNQKQKISLHCPFNHSFVARIKFNSMLRKLCLRPRRGSVLQWGGLQLLALATFARFTPNAERSFQFLPFSFCWSLTRTATKSFLC